jgi:hypothetical protein
MAVSFQERCRSTEPNSIARLCEEMQRRHDAPVLPLLLNWLSNPGKIRDAGPGCKPEEP